MKRKLSLTNLTNYRNTQQERKSDLAHLQSIIHALPNRILPIKVSFDVQNIKEQKIAAH